MLIAALIITAPKWKQRNCPSADKWINKKRYIHIENMAYPYNGIYSALKRNEILIPVTIWMNLGSILLTERRQIQKATCSRIPFI